MSFGILDQLMRQQVSGQQGPDSVRPVPVNARSSGQQPNIDPRQIMALGGMTQSTAQRPQDQTVAAAPPPKESLFSKIGSGIQKFTSDPEKMARLAAGFNTMRLNPDPNIAKMAENQIERSQTNKDANQTVALLRQKGFHDLASMVEANPTMAKEALTALAKRELGTDFSVKNVSGIQTAEFDTVINGVELEAGDNFTVTHDPNAQGGYTITKLGVKGLTSSEAATLEVETTNRIADQKLAQTKGIEIDQRISNVSEQTNIMSNMLDLLNSGAEVNIGFFQNLMPTVTGPTAAFESMANTLGIAVINSATFGALSATELKLALDTAIPRGLNPTQMKKYISDKLAVNEKLMNAMLGKQSALLEAGSYEQFQKDQNALMKENLAIMKQVPEGYSRAKWRDLSSNARRTFLSLGD